MLLDCTPQEVIDFLGHDGLKGVHIQEIQAFAISKGFILALVEARPVLDNVEVSTTLDVLKLGAGLLLGETSTGNKHCVAWDGEAVFDPNRHSIFSSIESLWILIDYPI